MSDRNQGPTRDASSMVEVLRDFQRDGFTADLFAEEGGVVRCGACDTVTPAGEIDVAQLRRIEGASDPSDMAAVVAAPCPSCGSQGVMVVMYGPEAGPADSDVLAALPTPADVEERPGA